MENVKKKKSVCVLVTNEETEFRSRGILKYALTRVMMSSSEGPARKTYPYPRTLTALPILSLWRTLAVSTLEDEIMVQLFDRQM